MGSRAVLCWLCVLLAGPAAAQREVFVGPAAAQREVFVGPAGVSFTITTERKTYRVDEHPVVKYRIENVGDQALYVPKGFDMTVCFDLGRPAPGPHIWGGLADSTGKRLDWGWGVSCSSTPGVPPPAVRQKLARIAVLLRPGEHADGVYEIRGDMSELTAGSSRVELTLSGWDAKAMSAEELAELQTMDHPLLEGTVPASAAITLPAK